MSVVTMRVGAAHPCGRASAWRIPSRQRRRRPRHEPETDAAASPGRSCAFSLPPSARCARSRPRMLAIARPRPLHPIPLQTPLARLWMRGYWSVVSAIQPLQLSVNARRRQPGIELGEPPAHRCLRVVGAGMKPAPSIDTCRRPPNLRTPEKSRRVSVNGCPFGKDARERFLGQGFGDGAMPEERHHAAREPRPQLSRIRIGRQDDVRSAINRRVAAAQLPARTRAAQCCRPVFADR